MILDKIFYKLGFAKIKGVQFDPLDEMQAERDKWFERYDREVMMHKNTIERAEKLEKEIDGFETMEFELREQLNAYKQKYADELQKRLELAEKLEECEADRNNWEFIASDYKQHLDHLEIGLNLADLLKREEPENAESVGEENV